MFRVVVCACCSVAVFLLATLLFCACCCCAWCSSVSWWCSAVVAASLRLVLAVRCFVPLWPSLLLLRVGDVQLRLHSLSCCFRVLLQVSHLQRRLPEALAEILEERNYLVSIFSLCFSCLVVLACGRGPACLACCCLCALMPLQVLTFCTCRCLLTFPSRRAGLPPVHPFVQPLCLPWGPLPEAAPSAALIPLFFLR